MKTQDMKILSGIGLAILIAVAYTQPVLAGETGIGAGPGNSPPQVYLLKKTFDICNDDSIPGGSVPPSGQQTGCTDFMGELRANEYAFTGEQIAELVAVRDLNGAIDIITAYLQVDGVSVVKCNDVGPVTEWFGHEIDYSQIPAKGVAPQGYDPRYDRIYECILTVTPNMDGAPSEVYVVATDEAGDEGTSPLQEWYFNPAIIIDVFTSDGNPVSFDTGTAGQTVYSTNTLKIYNDAEGGVDLAVWIAGTDLTSPDVAAKCPTSNVLDVDKYLEYRCKIGTKFNNEWNYVPNPNDKEPCYCAWGPCQGAKPLTPNTLPSILANQHTAECWFRLTYPVPCVGEFTDGQILIFARAI
jgi:hypothetical protein